MYAADTFKSSFKLFKSDKITSSSREVLTLNKPNSEEISMLHLCNLEDNRALLLGLEPFNLWKIYTFHRHPGLIMIRNPFTALGQKYWMRQSLEEYPKKPNKLNIDSEQSVDDWWSSCFRKDKCDLKLQKKLRWTTLGYHHNWDTKVYNENNRTQFPEDLAELSDVLACYLGYKNYKAEAAIVNYYHMDSTLSAHTDHSEVNLEAPLFSFSFGQSAIFLIGGPNKTVKPSAILLNSGDIVVMSKEARLCYHAVPKIVSAPSKPWDDNTSFIPNNWKCNFKYISNADHLISSMNKNVDSPDWNRFKDYIESSRINMNVRQVLNDKQYTLHEQNFNGT